MESDKKVYNKKIYYETFKNKHIDIIHKKIICETCGGKYTYFNKSRHLKLKKHIDAVEKNN